MTPKSQGSDGQSSEPIKLNQPHTVPVYVTVGDDAKAVISTHLPIIRRVVGTQRRGLYPQPGEWLWIAGLCMEGINHTVGFVPPPCDPVACTMSLMPLPGEEEPA